MARERHIHLPNDQARNIAVKCLLAFDARQIPIRQSLDAIRRESSIPEAEGRLAAELAYGCCRQRITLDHLIGKLSTRRRRNIEPPIRQILRVGLYQMLFVRGTPDFAAVHQAVQQAKLYGSAGAGNFVNAVLRSLQRRIAGPITAPRAFAAADVLWTQPGRGLKFQAALFPDPDRHPTRYFSSAFAHPVWLIERWQQRYAPEALLAILLANNTTPTLWLRPNRLRTESGQLANILRQEGHPTRPHGEALALERIVSPEKLPGYRQGWFYVQDLSAMSIVPLLPIGSGARVLDLCAAPGGKCTQLAERLGNRGAIVACDVNQEKLARLADNCRRLGITIIQTRRIDAPDFDPDCLGTFDAVMVDAPCSNTGVMARRPEVRSRLKPVDLRQLVQLQDRILRQASSRVRPAGYLLYSTCSIEPVENEQQIRRFLQAHPHFRLLKEMFLWPGRLDLAGPGHAILADSTVGSLTPPPAASPPVITQDGAYAALLQFTN
ncbi:MAG: 16S rRNA (cytosine(967)-C(5))-methyltransferase RsmB [Sedimentisphaerales bacterium]|nr:16S rRNA (cytosine(967)-C(5))-methyltransferase RsmB [Sedimentisphaerales bacterium]